MADLPAAPDHSLGLTRALLALVALIGLSTAAFIAIEGWSVAESLYFTILTITTVGYGDPGLSTSGRWVAQILMVAGIGLCTYTLALVVHATAVTEIARRKHMLKRIEELSGHTIVCGFGRMAAPLCADLREAGVAFAVVEQDEQAFLRAREAGFLAIHGLASEDDVLAAAGIAVAAHLVAAVDEGSENIVITLSARALNPDVCIIARAERDEETRKLVRAGATHVVRPYASGGREISNRILRPRLAELLGAFVDVDLGLTFGEVCVVEGSALAGVELGSYGRDAGSKLSFVALKREGKELLLQPRGATELEPGDVLVVAGDPGQLAAMRAQALA